MLKPIGRLSNRVGPRQRTIEFNGGDSIEIRVHHSHSLITAQLISMPMKKGPVQAVKWAGIVCMSLIDIVGTTLAVVAHSLNVLA